MKFYDVAGLETVKIFEIGKNEYALYKETEEGHVAIVMPGKSRPEIYGSLDDAERVASEICMVVYTADMKCAEAYVA